MSRSAYLPEDCRVEDLPGSPEEAEAERVQDLLEKGWCDHCPVEELCKQKLHRDWCLETHLGWPREED